MRDAFGDRAERAQAVQAAAADDHQVGALGRRPPTLGRAFVAVFMLAVGDRCDEPLVDALAAPGDNGVQLGIEALGHVAGGGVGGGRLDRAVDADDDTRGKPSFAWRATSTEEGDWWMISVATAPSTMPSRRPVPLLPTAINVSSSRSISSSSLATGAPRTSLPVAAV